MSKETNKQKRQKTKKNISKLWNNFKQTDINATGVSEGNDRKRFFFNFFEEIMTKMFFLAAFKFFYH